MRPWHLADFICGEIEDGRRQPDARVTPREMLDLLSAMQLGDCKCVLSDGTVLKLAAQQGGFYVTSCGPSQMLESA
ncbi:MAG TPA: hypothetical protein VIN03_12045 [Roseateles sp.]